MNEPKLGYRIIREIQRPPREALAPLEKITTGNVCDAMDRSGAMDWHIKPIDASMKCIGSAITVKARPCDNLIVYKALEIARPNDVIVIALGGYCGASTWGDLTSLIGHEKGLAGMVTDGMVRDAKGIKEVGFPVFARGTVPSSPFKDGPGEINVPVSCGGVVVRPGDVIFGDLDGVVVIPREYAADVIRAAVAIDIAEVQKVTAIKSGDWIPAWVDEKLKKLGYQLE